MWWNSMVGLGLEHAGRVTVGLSGLWHSPVRAAPFAADGSEPRGSGPVVLLGGLGETRPCLAPMVAWLERLGYDVTAYTIQAGMGCSQRTVDSLTRRVQAIADEAGQPVRIVGHSRGGQFGRAIGNRLPESVSHLVTLGTPFDRFGLTPPMAAVAWGLATMGSTTGIPGLLGLGCLLGTCCREFRAGLRDPWPADRSFTSIYSRTDAAVPWRSSHDAHAENVVVRGGHVSLLTSAAAQRAVARALADTVVAPERDPAVVAA